MEPLPRIKAGLLRHPLDSQVLVYDPGTARVHLLDPTTACVMDLLLEGYDIPQAITRELATRLRVSENPGLLLLALDQLSRAELLEDMQSPVSLVDSDRRGLLRKIALAGAAAVLMPAIATVAVGTAYAQGSPLAEGAACTGNSQCASNRCCRGSCHPSTCTPDGAFCNDSDECACCSGTCLGVFNQCAQSPQPDGTACSTNVQCQSGRCCGGLCRPAACLSSGTPCFGLDACDCCSGACSGFTNRCI